MCVGEEGKEGRSKKWHVIVRSFNHSTWVQGVRPHLGEVQFSHAQKVVSDEGTVPVVHHKRQRNLDVYTVHILQQEHIRTGGLSKST